MTDLDSARERLRECRELADALRSECYSEQLGGFDESAYRRYMAQMQLVHAAEDRYQEALDALGEEE